MSGGELSASVARGMTHRKHAWRVHRGALFVLIAGVALTLALSWAARTVHDTNEDRLLRERVQEAAAAISGVLPSLDTPLASAAEVAEATKGSSTSFAQVMTPQVGAGRRFSSVSLWSIQRSRSPRPIRYLGARPAIQAKNPTAFTALLARAGSGPELRVVGLLDSPTPRLGYALSSARRTARYVVYAESVLPKNRRSAVIQANAAFSDLGYALYLGSERPQNLLAANAPHVPVTGRRSAATIPLGDNSIRLVMTPITELGGSLLARLQWLLLGFGLLLAFGATAMTERLVRRREYAQGLADELGDIAEENARLYAAQRTVAHTLQHSLLPESLPDTPGLVVQARYIAGVADIDIGGDWYDVIHLSDGRVMFVVGDVSGRGLAAATVMASLRYATRAYAAQGDDPATILTKLSTLVSVSGDGHFATVLCGVIDVDRHEIVLANAAHPEPLLIGAEPARFVSTNIGVPIGVQGPKPYVPVKITVPMASTLLAFTDGLIERRGEIVDVGLQRLRDAADRSQGSVDELLTNLTDDLPPDGPSDDIAILGVKWMN